MSSFLEFIGLGASLGLGAGISPGPLLALVIAASIRSGLGGGLRVAVAPFLTDVPIVILALLALSRVPPDFLRGIGLVGGLVVVWLGFETLRSARAAVVPDGETEGAAGRELWRGVLVNALNPHPYLFWTTVGGPALMRGWQFSAWHVAAFLGSFYLLLVGSKVVVAWLVSRQAGGLSLLWYRRVLAGCGVLMLVLGGWFIYQALVLAAA